MTLDDYLSLISLHAKPTEAQTERFIAFVANDHSWYKHLPLDRSEPFHFYFDPNVGLRLERITSGIENPPIEGFHFQSNTTNVYQEKYGIWQYFTTRYTVNYSANSENQIHDPRPFLGLRVADSNGVAQSLPEEILTQGKFMMSRFLHQNAFSGTKEHTELIADLKKHLQTLVHFIFEKR